MPRPPRFAVAASALLAVMLASCSRHAEDLAPAEPTATAAPAAAEGKPGLHDHTPHHGGVVAMVGMIHLEAKASADGRVELYVSDLWRRPLPVDETSGAVVLDLPDGKRSFPLEAAVGALRASAPPLGGRDVAARFSLRRGGEPLEVSFLLPLAQNGSGAAGVPLAGCVSMAGEASAERQPRCVLAFEKPVAALASSADAAQFLVSIIDLGISDWRLPAGEFAIGFAPPPPITVPLAEAPHAEAPNAVVVRPDGREAAVALEKQVVVYSMASGQVLRAFDGTGGILRAAAYSPDGGELLVSAFYDRAASLLSADDGRVLRRFAVEREAAAVAFAEDGKDVAVASQLGPVSLFAAEDASLLRVLGAPRGGAVALAFCGERVVAAGHDGVLRAWDRGSGALLVEQRLSGPVYRMALAPDRERVALATGPRLEIRNLRDGSLAETLAWHGAPVTGLAWAGTTLVSGDVDGRVALWNAGVPEP